MIGIVQDIVLMISEILICAGILLSTKARRKGDYDKAMTWVFFAVTSSSFGILIYFILRLYSSLGGK